ncbi:hypothetical protein RUM43_010156 [Polyplax serrata]|uniref:Uncharacterized protein n=1 Tax=Polyplax serrata TaxID=468196 RepID=A0AAN8PL01_POLSC
MLKLFTCSALGSGGCVLYLWYLVVLTIHGNNLTNLFKIVPQEILPDDYGGQADSVQTLHDQHRKLVEGKYEKWIEEEEFYVIDERKRSKATTKKECFVSNTFRSLQID